MCGKFVTETLLNNRKRDRFLNQRQIAEIFYYLVNEYGLKNYISVISFAEMHPSADQEVTAEYIIDEKRIMVYEKAMRKYRTIVANDYTLGDKSYKKLFINEAIIQILIHELIHVSQIKFLFGSEDYNYEYEIMRNSYIGNFIDNNLQLPYLEKYYGGRVKDYYQPHYREFKRQIARLVKVMPYLHEYDPAENNAEYEATKEIIYLNEYINPKLNEDWKDMLHTRTENLYRFHKGRIISPFEIYRNRVNKILTLDQLELDKDAIQKMSLDKRLSLGLPISKVEYREMKDYINSLHL